MGSSIEHMDDLRPGDLIQTWKASTSGHSTLVHSVTGDGPKGKLTLGPDDEAREVVLSSVRVDQLGSHDPVNASEPPGVEPRQNQHPDQHRPGDSIHVKEDVDLDGKFDHGYAVRPRPRP
jgi:hypothetical protein